MSSTSFAAITMASCRPVLHVTDVPHRPFPTLREFQCLGGELVEYARQRLCRAGIRGKPSAQERSAAADQSNRGKFPYGARRFATCVTRQPSFAWQLSCRWLLCDGLENDAGSRIFSAPPTRRDRAK